MVSWLSSSGCSRRARFGRSSAASSHYSEAARANALLESGQVVGNLVLVASELLEASRAI
jgi:hypothetical protein